jgi:hypothetical protein
MTERTPTYLEPEVSTTEALLGKLKGLSTGSLVMVVGGVVLFFTLFLTWQTLEVTYVGTGKVPTPQDGWDVWGLLIGLGSVALVSLVIAFHGTEVEIVPGLRWQTLVLGLGIVIFAFTVVKNLTDADSAWASYLGLALAALVAVGAYLEWARRRLSSDA